MNICLVVAARPNFMKVAPLMRALDRSKAKGLEVDYKLVFTGTADDGSLEGTIFDDLEIRRPDVFLGVDCENLNELTGRVMAEFEKYLQKYPADMVVVVDDLASTMAASIVTKKQGLKLVHLAAGTRSFDINMPKEINRLVIDGLSDILFTAGISNNSIVNKEGGELSKVYMVGNILIDNLRHCYNKQIRPRIFDEKNISEKNYIVFTLNRKALMADKEKLSEMLKSISAHADGIKIVAPLRDQAAKVVRELVGNDEHFEFIEPLTYLEFAYAMRFALGIITDSGNVAEEATFYGVPCITLNSYTEHIETVKVGTNVLVGENPHRLGEELSNMVQQKWKNAGIPERWDGRSAERMVQIMLTDGGIL